MAEKDLSIVWVVPLTTDIKSIADIIEGGDVRSPGMEALRSEMSQAPDAVIVQWLRRYRMTIQKATALRYLPYLVGSIRVLAESLCGLQPAFWKRWTILSRIVSETRLGLYSVPISTQ